MTTRKQAIITETDWAWLSNEKHIRKMAGEKITITEIISDAMALYIKDQQDKGKDMQ